MFDLQEADMFAEMATLFVKDLVFVGVHGQTAREPHDKQRFRVTIEVQVDPTQAARTDSIKDAFDYKIATAIAKHVIEGPRCALIETLASKIARRICNYEHVWAARVSIEKLDAAQQCTPGIVVLEKHAPQGAEGKRLLDIDVPDILAGVKEKGAVSVPILPDEYRLMLLEEAGIYEYQKQPEVVGPAKVREQLSSVSKFYSGSLFHRLRQEFEKEFMFGMAIPTAASFFPKPLAFNELSLQRYEKGSIGITPHKDGLSRINLVCVFILQGTARFALCDDREGTNPYDLDTTPGNVIIVRAPGFKGETVQPLHFVSDVTEDRIVFSLRQKI